MATPARAGFEGVGHFAGSAAPVTEEKFAEEVQLGGVGGMAVNYTGAGGVTAGTVYAATRSASEGVQVAMFSPTIEASKLVLEFTQRWEVRDSEPYVHCGPALPQKCQPKPKGNPELVTDVDVDQATGNVYVYTGTSTVGSKAIVVYSPDGGEVVARFGELAAGGTTTAETPDKIHDSGPGAIAVNSAGELYFYDINAGIGANFYHRLMKFVPKVPGKFNEYEYAGSGEDVAAAFKPEKLPSQPVADAAGMLYTVSQESTIEKYDPAKPGDPPLCRFIFAKGGITAITVTPESGEVFFFSYKPPISGKPKRVYRLGPCDETTGEFGKPGNEIVDEFEVKPERDDLGGLAFDPVRQFSLSRAPGVLYGGAPRPVPSSGVGIGEPGQSSLGYIFTAAEENAPVVKSESVSRVTATSAQLRAVIDPKGSQTKYVFQYLTEAEYQGAGKSFAGAEEVPLGGASLSGTGVPESVGETVVGLEPDTAYRYRVVASSHCSATEKEKVCEGSGPAQTFRTFPFEVPPPGGRAYELVSPPDKHGGQVLPADPRLSSCGPETICKPGNSYEHFPMQSAPGGDSIVYEGTSFGGGAAIENEYIARRGDSGWQSTNLTPSLLSSKEGQGYKAFDPTLTDGVLMQPRPALSLDAPPEYENFYTQPTASPLTLGALLTTAPPNRPATEGGRFQVSYTGVSADLSRVFFAANDALTAEVPGIAPAAVDGGANKFNLYEWERATRQLRLVNVAPGNLGTEPGAVSGAGSAHTISADGSRVFWSNAAGELFVREDAEATKEIPGSGKFLSAALDGSKVLLTDGNVYDLEAETTTDLTGGKGGFQGLVGQSDDLSHVYFVDTEVLSGEEENSEGAKAQPGKFNLYSRGGGSSHFVATLVAQDNDGSGNTHSKAWAPYPSDRTAEASPQGRFLAFLSEAPLIPGYDNTGPCEPNHAGGLVERPCPEVFLYDSSSSHLFCASCNPSGSRPLGWSALRLIKGRESLPQARYLTDSGRLYFDSRDSLSQLDTNDGVEDVYEFKPAGAGGCGREDGCVALISSGRDGADSNFLAIDATGKNVFFTSRGRLVNADQDELIDLYDAREGGGAPPASVPSPGQLPLQIPPFEPTPASPTLSDPGNVKPAAACKKGQVKKKGKCVKKHKPKAKQQKQNRKRGGAK